MVSQHDLAKKRTCTLGLYGPWGGNSSVFIRVTFTFPKEYPQGPHPRGTPSLELERSPLVHVKDRAFMLRRLKFIRERRRPCLEACLRFLLFGTDDEVSAAGTRGRMPLDSESSSDDDGMPATKSKEITANLLRGHKNLAEPRTSQGIFAPNGQSLDIMINDAVLMDSRRLGLLFQSASSYRPQRPPRHVCLASCRY